MERSGREDQACTALEGYKAPLRASAALREATLSLKSDAFAPKLDKTLQDAELGMGRPWSRSRSW